MREMSFVKVTSGAGAGAGAPAATPTTSRTAGSMRINVEPFGGWSLDIPTSSEAWPQPVYTPGNGLAFNFFRRLGNDPGLCADGRCTPCRKRVLVGTGTVNRWDRDTHLPQIDRQL